MHAFLRKAPSNKLAFQTCSTKHKRHNPQPTCVPPSTKNVATGQQHNKKTDKTKTMIYLICFLHQASCEKAPNRQTTMFQTKQHHLKSDSSPPSQKRCRHWVTARENMCNMVSLTYLARDDAPRAGRFAPLARVPHPKCGPCASDAAHHACDLPIVRMCDAIGHLVSSFKLKSEDFLLCKPFLRKALSNKLEF